MLPRSFFVVSFSFSLFCSGPTNLLVESSGMRRRCGFVFCRGAKTRILWKSLQVEVLFSFFIVQAEETWWYLAGCDIPCGLFSYSSNTLQKDVAYMPTTYLIYSQRFLFLTLDQSVVPRSSLKVTPSW